MIDDTVVVVMSEMSRTPLLSGDAPHKGKGHWPLTAALVIGGGVRGGAVFGATTAAAGDVPVDLATGRPSPQGIQPMYSHFIAGLLAAPTPRHTWAELRCSMRSSADRARLVLTVAAAGGLAALASCGRDTDPACDASFLRYDNFGAPFITNWCRACPSRALPADMRQQAPPNINFDSLHEIHAWSRQIASAAGTGTTMPPAGGPSTDERALLSEWLGCGALSTSERVDT